MYLCRQIILLASPGFAKRSGEAPSRLAEIKIRSWNLQAFFSLSQQHIFKNNCSVLSSSYHVKKAAWDAHILSLSINVLSFHSSSAYSK